MHSLGHVLDFLITLSLGMVKSIRKMVQPEVENVTTDGEYHEHDRDGLWVSDPCHACNT